MSLLLEPSQNLQARMGRVGADTKPVADEKIYEVVRRHLSADMGDEQVREAVLSACVKQYRELSN